MSKTKIIRPYKNAIEIMMQKERVQANGAYDTVKSNPLSMDDPSPHFFGI